MTNILSKKELRKEKLSIRKSMDYDSVKKKSKKICDSIIKYISDKNIKDICLYSPIHNEVNLFYLEKYLFDNNITIWLPKIHDDIMDFYRYEGRENLVKGYFDILEPSSKELLYPSKTTLIIMPGAVFSKSKDRIGYGGGYYDSYLSKNCDAMTIAVGYDFQLVDEIKSESHDIKPDLIITDIQIID